MMLPFIMFRGHDVTVMMLLFTNYNVPIYNFTVLPQIRVSVQNALKVAIVGTFNKMGTTL